jgi:hypothetical protein
MVRHTRILIACVVAVCVALVAETAHAERTVGVGAVAGVTLGPYEYFPTYLVGAIGSADQAVASRLAIGLLARVQYYHHREEEDFGSRGFQEDLSAVVRLHLFKRGLEPPRFNPFIAARFGAAIVERFPFSATADSELIGGYIWGVSVGLDFRSKPDATLQRVELSFDMPSFTTHDDAVRPVGELSIAFAGAFAL